MALNIEIVKTAVSYLGAVGIGSLATLLINHYLTSRENKKKLLFESRVRAYSGLVSRFFNLFNELDINRLSEALRHVKINELLSEAYLLGSSEFVEMLGKFLPDLHAFHRALDEAVQNNNADDTEARALHKKLIEDIGKIYNRMRADLYLEDVEISELNREAAGVDAFQLRGLSTEEISQKNKRSVEEVLNVEKITEEIAKEDQDAVSSQPVEEQVTINKSSYVATIPQIESRALDKVEASTGKILKRQVFFANLPYKFDAALIDDKTLSLRFFEVKVFPNLPKNKHGKPMSFIIVDTLRKAVGPTISALSEYLRSKKSGKLWKYSFTLIIVLNTKNDFLKIRGRIEDLREEFNRLGKEGRIEVNFIFYNLKNMDFDLE